MSSEDASAVEQLVQRTVGRWALIVIVAVAAGGFYSGVEFAGMKNEMANQSASISALTLAVDRDAGWKASVTPSLARHEASIAQHENRLGGLERRVYRQP